MIPAFRWKDAYPEILAFSVTALLAYFLRWEPGDLLWSLWAGSLAFCVLGVFVAIGSLPFHPPSANTIHEPPNITHPVLKRLYFAVTMVFVLFAATAFAAGVFGFHYFYGYFIYMLFPLIPEIPNVFDLTERQFEQALINVARGYWPFVLIVLLNERHYFLSVIRRDSPLNVGVPILRLFRIHVFIMLSVLFVMIGGTGYFFYLVILLFFFFPWRLMFVHASGRPR